MTVPNIPKVNNVDVRRLNPLDSSKETNGVKMNARRIDRASIISISLRR
jgi:hypothetical protein